MEQKTPSVHLTLRDDPAPTRALRAALDEIGARFGLADDELFELKVAATEALTNAIKGSVTGRPVCVAVEPGTEAIEVEVRNHGAFELGEPTLDDVDSESGRGIALMFALVDEVEFASTGDGTRVRIRKRLGRAFRAGPRPRLA
ncbi:MAG TPA: ATP-binding protein [Gaiellaceae bacterium]|nr:ATP-binding protein [Gaiellaceae bacterium]